MYLINSPECGGITGWLKKVSHKVLSISLSNIDRLLKFFHWHILLKICNKIVTKPYYHTYTSLHYLLKYEICKNRSLFGDYMNKSLELNFWPILYDSIVFLSLQTQKVYLKQNII